MTVTLSTLTFRVGVPPSKLHSRVHQSLRRRHETQLRPSMSTSEAGLDPSHGQMLTSNTRRAEACVCNTLPATWLDQVPEVAYFLFGVFWG